MKMLLNGSWHVELEDGTTGQMDLPGTLDKNGIGHRDVGANQWHPDAALGNAAGEIDKDAPIATRFTRRHIYEGEARISRKIMLMCDKVTHKNLIDSSPLFREKIVYNLEQQGGVISNPSRKLVPQLHIDSNTGMILFPKAVSE